MIVDVVQESQPDLAEYAGVPIAFEVREIVDIAVDTTQPDRFALRPRPVAVPWMKDYDALDGGPRGWPARFDLSHWTFFAARAASSRVGGAVVVMRAPDVEMLHGRDDVAVLWDIRVVPAKRGGGIGTALLEAAEAWAIANGARWLEVETQDVNAAACRFYGRRGFVLRTANPTAYPDLPNETQLLWYKELGG